MLKDTSCRKYREGAAKYVKIDDSWHKVAALNQKLEEDYTKKWTIAFLGVLDGNKS